MSSSGEPLVSVIIPAFNHERYVEQAVRSVWGQTYRNVEIILIDDGSSDRTGEIAKRLADISPIPMLAYSRENQGLAKTRNEAIAHAKGDWICFLDSDDYYAPGFIEKHLARARESSTEFVAVHGDAYFVDEYGTVGARLARIWRYPPASGNAFLAIARGKCFLTIVLLTSATAIRKIGGFDPDLVLEDLDFWLRLARQVRFEYTDEPLVYLRRVASSLGQRPWTWRDDVFTALEKHADLLGPELPELLVDRCLKLGRDCILYGRWRPGVRWAREAVRRSTGYRGRIRTGGRVAYVCSLAAGRRLVRSMLPNSAVIRLRRLKHLVQSFVFRRNAV